VDDLVRQLKTRLLLHYCLSPRFDGHSDGIKRSDKPTSDRRRMWRGRRMRIRRRRRRGLMRRKEMRDNFSFYPDEDIVVP
jgi:hypothetical protein